MTTIAFVSKQHGSDNYFGNQISAEYIRLSPIKIFGFIILNIVLAFLPLMAIYWSSKCYSKMLFENCPARKAAYVKVTNVI